MSLHDELCQLAMAAASEAAAMVLARHGERHEAATKASDLDLVTAIDKASEELIVNRLLSARPHDGVVGEEGTGVTGTSGVEWLVDPIDGTTSFFYGLPGFSVSIAARVDGELVVGVVDAPAVHSTYVAQRGNGATLNARPVSCRPVESISKALIATGFSPDHERRQRQSDVMARLIPQIRDIRRMGSAALDLAAVAGGQIDAYFEAGLNVWDYAAGIVLAAEAGATTWVEEDPSTGRAFVFAAAPDIADDLAALIRSLNADKV